jgi:hypothetical protein
MTVKAASAPAVTPLDPDSDKGRDVAQRLGEVFAEVREAIAGRKARAALEEAAPDGP